MYSMPFWSTAEFKLSEVIFKGGKVYGHRIHKGQDTGLFEVSDCPAYAEKGE
jgi:hypothetical protein